MNELGKFTVAVGDVIGIGEEGVIIRYLATGIKGEYCEIWRGLGPKGVNFQACCRRNSVHSS